jgi:HD superfamily phosphohydrolase
MGRKVIRDNLHGDIELTPEEMKLLHTAGFERLHGCRQLGLSHLIYPGAKHSRFEHVLGVMHVADKIAERMEEEKCFFIGSEGEELRRILRFSALLHDMGHVPFGHTLEDEMPVISKHDRPSSDKTKPSRMELAVSEVLNESGNARYTGPVLQVLRAIAESKDDDEVYDSVESGAIKPEYLVLADIIGNTICADLLDYIKRDHSMTGIRATYDSRIFRYFGVDEHKVAGHKGYKRVVIQLVRHGRVRNDVLADLLDILKLRYNLSDKVLFHPKKCAADAMLIRAVSLSGLAKEENKLMQFSDDGLLDHLRESPLIAMIRRWSLFKHVFVCGKNQINTYNDQLQKNDLIKNLHRDEELRKRIETSVEKEVGLPANQNSVLIFCPSPKMTLKSVRALVKWKDGTVRRLNEIGGEDDPLVHEQVTMLQDIYPQLWKLYLFCEPHLRSLGKRIEAAFCEILEDETGLTATCDPAHRHYLKEGCSDYRLGLRLDQQLELHSEVKKLPKSERDAVAVLSHARIPPDPLSDEYADSDTKVLASRQDEAAVRSKLNEIIDSVLKERKSSSSSGQLSLVDPKG